MGDLSHHASNAIMYTCYAILLISGVAIAYITSDKKTFLAANGSQKGVPLAFNFVASGLGCGILTTYPQIANIAGLEGLLVYAITGGLPMFLFSFLGPIVRRQCPHGFVLTEWVFHRFGLLTGLYISACTILTLFLFMVSEIASLRYAVTTLTGLNALPVAIVECVVTSIYTAVGGFKISFITDNLQIMGVMILIIVVSCSMGTHINIDRSKIGESGLLKSNKLSGQLIYIFIIAIFTNDLFMSGFWLRTFAAKTNKDLWIGCSIAAFLLTAIVTVVGVTGLIAVWGGFLPVGSDDSGDSFFIILAQMPSWVMGFVLVFIVIISTCTLDSLQSALASTISNDLFRNKVPIIWVRIIVVIIIVPVVVVGIKVADDVLQIYFIADLLSAAVIPMLLLGLSSWFYFITGWEVITAGLGGLLSVFIFGTVYYHSAEEGAKLMLIWNGVYADNWGAFGAFVVAPFGGMAFGFAMLALRLTVLKINSIFYKTKFTALDRPEPVTLKSQESSDIEEEITRVEDIPHGKMKLI